MPKLLESCMFCDQLPCACNSKPTKKKVTRVASVPDTSTDRRSVSKPVVPEVKVHESPKKVTTRKDPDELRAIRVLAWLGMLSPETLRQYSDTLTVTCTGQLLKYL